MPTIDSLPPEAPNSLIAIEQADLAIAEKAGELRKHPVVEALGAASEMADQPPLIALSVTTIVAGLVLRRPQVAAAGLRMISAHFLATAIKSGVKRSVDRTRPYVLAEEGEYAIEEGGSHDPRLNSFPSGHTAGAVAVAEAVARTFPRVAWPARAWAVVIAAIQIPRCAHYPSDIAVGATIGLAGDRLVRLAEGAVRRGLAR